MLTFVLKNIERFRNKKSWSLRNSRKAVAGVVYDNWSLRRRQKGQEKISEGIKDRNPKLYLSQKHI